MTGTNFVVDYVVHLPLSVAGVAQGDAVQRGDS